MSHRISKIIMKILFVVHADKNSGGGHFFRSLQFANFLNKYNDIKINFFSKYLSSYYINSCNFKLIKKLDIFYDLIIFDGYIFDENKILDAKKKGKKVMILDDLCNRKLSVDYIWDPSPTRSKEQYKKYTERGTKFFLGTKYHIVNDNNKLNSIKPKFVHLYFGQKFSLNHYKIYKLLSKKTKYPILYLCGLKKVPFFMKKTRQIDKILPFTNNFDNTILESFICVGTPGSSLWKKLKYNRHCIVLSNNRNQVEICNSLHIKKLITYIGDMNSVLNKSKIKFITLKILQYKKNFINYTQKKFHNSLKILSDELISDLKNHSLINKS